MTAVSAARLSQVSDQRAGPLVFSMEDEKRHAYNEFFAERILSILTQEQTWQKCEDLLADLLSLGVKAAWNLPDYCRRTLAEITAPSALRFS